MGLGCDGVWIEVLVATQWSQHEPNCKSWLVEEEHDGIMNDVDSDGDTMTFTTINVAVALVTDEPNAFASVIRTIM